MSLSTNIAAGQHSFALVPDVKRPRSAFDRSHKKIMTIDFDYLYPLYCRQALPGDTFSIHMNTFARLQTSVVPLMDNLFFTLQAFFIPNRLLQDTWQRMISNEQDNPSQDNSTLATYKLDLTTTPVGGIPNKHLLDYLGFPTKVDLRSSTAWIHMLPALAYNLIWNTHYRDQNLQNPAYFSNAPGTTVYDYANFNLLKRGKRFDQNTSALTSVQKGTASSVAITGQPIVKRVDSANIYTQLYKVGSNTIASAGTMQIDGSGKMNDGSNQITMDPRGSLYVDLSTAPAYFLINDFRTSYSVQLLLEADARGGTRYIESMLHRWGVRVPDYRLDRPEYIAYTETNFNSTPVPQTSVTATTPQGNLAAFTTQSGALSFTHSAIEYGWVMILGSARANITYQQGLPKEFTYKTRYDWYFPEFAHLGEQGIKLRELYMTGVDANDNTVFGYQEYGYEHRYTPSTVHGEMRSNDTNTLDMYHMADKYTSAPALNAAWIQSTTPISRNIVSSSNQAIRLDIFTKETYTTSMPVYSVPGLGRML